MKIKLDDRDPQELIPQQETKILFRLGEDEEYRLGEMLGNFFVDLSTMKPYHYEEVFGWLDIWGN